MNYKSMKFALKDFNDNTFEGYASFFNNIDSYNDVIEKGAFKKTIKENRSRIKILWQHDISEPIGIPISMYEDDNGLYVKGKISDTDYGRKALTLIKDGVITEMSIGYDVIKDDYTQMKGQKVRLLKEVRLWEFSPVTFAANDQARILKYFNLLNSLKSDTMLFDRAINSLQTLVHEKPTEEVILKSLEPEDEELKSILNIIKQLKQGDVK